MKSIRCLLGSHHYHDVERPVKRTLLVRCGGSDHIIKKYPHDGWIEECCRCKDRRWVGFLKEHFLELKPAEQQEYTISEHEWRMFTQVYYP